MIYPSQFVNIAKKFEYWFENLKKKASKWTIKRVLKEFGFRWRRVRKSLESQRDPIMYAFLNKKLSALQEENKQGKIRLVFNDESGISQNRSGEPS